MQTERADSAGRMLPKLHKSLMYRVRQDILTLLRAITLDFASLVEFPKCGFRGSSMRLNEFASVGIDGEFAKFAVFEKRSPSMGRKLIKMQDNDHGNGNGILLIFTWYRV